ncbi:MAG: hypothetical protein IJE68_03640 [Clostridia bacterium]|nr:hypothetical protein [Clostridia bacterium]
MSKIIIEANTSYLAQDAVVFLLKGGFSAKTARISYAVRKALPPVEQVENYPLILEGFIGNSPVSIYVYSVTAGYGGTGPHAMVDILKAAGFTFDESDILTDRMKVGPSEQITLTYER